MLSEPLFPSSSSQRSQREGPGEQRRVCKPQTGSPQATSRCGGGADSQVCAGRSGDTEAPKEAARLQGCLCTPSSPASVPSPSGAHRLSVAPHCLHPSVPIPTGFPDLPPPTAAALKGTFLFVTVPGPPSPAPPPGLWGAARFTPFSLLSPIAVKAPVSMATSTEPSLSLQLSPACHCCISRPLGVPSGAGPWPAGMTGANCRAPSRAPSPGWASL